MSPVMPRYRFQGLGYTPSSKTFESITIPRAWFLLRPLCVSWFATQLKMVLLNRCRRCVWRPTLREVKETKLIRNPHLLVFMTFPCCGVELAALGQRGTIQGTFWISEPMHKGFLKFSGIDREQALSRVRYEPTPQVFVQADQGLQSNSFFTETVSKTMVFYHNIVRNVRTWRNLRKYLREELSLTDNWKRD